MEELEQIPLIVMIGAEDLVLISVILAQFSDRDIAGEETLHIEFLGLVRRAQIHIAVALIYSLYEAVNILCIL